MDNSELATRVSRDRALLPGRELLVDAVTRRWLRVVAIDPACKASLSHEGIDVGVELGVERRLALGGPLIVRLGRARLAVSRSIARGVFVELVEGPQPEC